MQEFKSLTQKRENIFFIALWQTKTSRLRRFSFFLFKNQANNRIFPVSSSFSLFSVYWQVMPFISVFWGGILPSWRRKCKFFLKTKSSPSSFAVDIKIKSSLLPAIKNNKTGNSQNFFRWRETEKSATSRKNHQKPQIPFLGGRAGKNKNFLFGSSLFILYLWPMVILGKFLYRCTFFAYLTVLWRRFDGVLF